MSAIDDGFNAVADLALWYKLQNGDQLMLGDLRQLIPAYWIFIRDNWGFLQGRISGQVDSYNFPQLLRSQIEDMTDFVELHRHSKTVSNPFSRSDMFFRFQAVFEVFDLSLLATSNASKKLIDKELERVRAFTKKDFIAIRNKIAVARDSQSDLVSGTDADYNRVYGRVPETATKHLDVKDVDFLDTFTSAIRTCDFVLANLTDLQTVTVDPFALAKINANNPDIDIQSSTAGTLVRMQYGDTLADLAQRYLGDSDRWMEIAIANGLSAPYVDEIGETIKLATSGSDSRISVSALDTALQNNINKFAINQIVFLFSDSITFPEQRVITDITTIPANGEIVLRLSGDPDLDKFKKSENATIRIYKLNTVNSNFFVVIPNPGAEVDPINRKDTPWFLKTKQADEKQTGVDLALSSDSDLIFSSNGDLVLSYGLANAIQAVQIKLSTEYGSLRRHPDFGVVNVVGRATNNFESTRAELTDSIVQAIELDSRFASVQSIDVAAISDAMTSGFLVQLVVRLAGTGSTIPISFTVNF